jgi:hypothetical protein
MMMGCRRDDACRKMFPFLEILPLPSQYSFPLLLFVIKNMKTLLSILSYIKLKLDNMQTSTNQLLI